MAAAVAGPLLSAELGALVGLGTFAEARKEEVFAPFCGKWIKVRCYFKHNTELSQLQHATLVDARASLSSSQQQHFHR